MADLHAAFLADIIANPADDTPRLIYADWLDEQGENERAEFIRLQIRIATERPDPKRHIELNAETGRWERVDYCGRCEHCRLRARERELLVDKQGGYRWANGINLLWLGFPPVMWPKRFRRGFVAEIALPCADWLTHGEGLLRAVPLERVTLGHVTAESVWRTPEGKLCCRVAPAEDGEAETLTVRDGHLWYLAGADRAGDAFEIQVIAAEGSPLRQRRIEDAFRGFWNEEVVRLYRQQILSGAMTVNEARALMRREILPDFSV